MTASWPSSAASRAALPVADCALTPADPEFAQTGLRAASVIHLDKIATLHRQVVPRRRGMIGPQTQQRIAAALRAVFDL